MCHWNCLKKEEKSSRRRRERKEKNAKEREMFWAPLRMATTTDKTMASRYLFLLMTEKYLHTRTENE